jgi:transcription antitermination protein NusB
VGKRRTAREMALQMLFQLEQGRSAVRDVLESYHPGDVSGEGEGVGVELEPGDLQSARGYAEAIVAGVVESREQIDELIRSQATNWRLERMPVVDRTVLRIGVYELLRQIDVPQVVIVDEAIELAKRYGSEQSGAFVNGVLDGLLHSQKFPGRLH